MTSVTYAADAFPAELTDRDQWLLWDADADRKQPFTWNGHQLKPASWSDPDDWLPFGKAHEVAQDHDSVGVGFVLAQGIENYPGVIGGLDLDGCVDEEGELKQWLPPLDETFGDRAYMEYSQSGTGVHVPLMGFTLPEWWTNVSVPDREHEGVEAYEKKFFVFTGDTLPSSSDGIGQLPQDEIEEWLATAAENITGTDPRDEYTPSRSDSDDREPTKSRSEIEDLETTEDLDDIYDAVDHLEPSDLPLSSSYQEDENSEFESWDPGYRHSGSGLSLKRATDSGRWIDMKLDAESSFSTLALFAAERGIITNPTDRLEGDDFVAAVDAARDAGAPIPEFTGGGFGDLPDDSPSRSEVTDEQTWELWSGARAEGSLGGDSIVPRPALRYLAQEHGYYDFDPLPADAEELPAKAHNKALYYVENKWAEEVGIDDEEDVTARDYTNRLDAAVRTWEDVRYVYDESKEEGRLASVSLLRERYEFITPQDTEVLHVYDEDLGIFDKTAKFVIGRELDRNLGRHYSQHEKREIIERLKEKTVERSELEAKQFSTNYICVKNGVIDLDDRELLDHDPKYNFTTFLPVAYDRDAECPEIRDFLDDITKREADAKTLLEVLGHTLLPNYDFELFLVLFGEGSNGKSTWYDVVRTFLNGPNSEVRNVQNLSLQRLSENRFAGSELVGQWANIGEDLPEKKIQDLGAIKDLTGGGETYVEPKGKEGFNFENRATMMFAANRPPILGERSFAVKRRLTPIHLPYKFKSDPDPDDPYEKQAEKEGLGNRLTTDDELSGLLNAALDGLSRLRENEDVSLPESYDERLELYERHSDHIKAFRVDCMENQSSARVQKDDVYNAYTAYCEEHDYAKVGRTVFWRQLRQTTLNVTVKRPQMDDGSRPRVLVDATFKPEGYRFAPDAAAPEDVEQEEDKSEAENSEAAAAHEATPISKAADSLTGYVTVTTEIVSTRRLGEQEKGLKAILKDTSGVMDLVVWDDVVSSSLEELEGESVVIRHAEVSEYDGSRQLSHVDGVTEFGRIQQGVAYTEGESPEEDQATIEESSDRSVEESAEKAEADGGSVAGSETASTPESDLPLSRLRTHFRNEVESGEQLSPPSLAGAVGIAPDVVADALATFAQRGEMVEETAEGYRLV